MLSEIMTAAIPVCLFGVRMFFIYKGVREKSRPDLPQPDTIQTLFPRGFVQEPFRDRNGDLDVPSLFGRQPPASQ